MEYRLDIPTIVCSEWLLIFPPDICKADNDHDNPIHHGCDDIRVPNILSRYGWHLSKN